MGDIKYTPADSTINTLNGKMRAEPWYQDWFRARGLNPNQVKLSDKQQKELEGVMAQNGYALPDGIHVDPAGNWNTKHGWAGLPAVTKAAIVALGAVGTAGAAGAFGGAGGGANAAAGGSTAAASGGSAASLPVLSSTAYGPVAGATAPSLTGAVTGTGMTVGAGGGVSGALKKAGGSVIDRIMNADDQTFADVGSLFERFGNDEAMKRLSDYNLNRGFNQDSINAQQDRRLQEADAMKKIQQAGYIKSGGAPFDASQVKLANGRELPSFSFPRAPITDEAKQAAGMLEKTMLERLGPNGSFTPKPIEQFTDRGVGEQVGRWGGVATGAIPMAKGIWDLFR